MEPTYSIGIVILWTLLGLFTGWLGGWVGCSYLARRYMEETVKECANQIHAQYTHLLNRFEIYRKPNGEWQSHAGGKITSGREVEAHTRSG